jgi:hypothetical protein
MRNTAILLGIISLMIMIPSCEKDEYDSGYSTDGFCVKIANKSTITHIEIDYYDISSHLIYLKQGNPFLKTITEVETFTVYANGIEIYSGHVVPGYSSTLYPGPLIWCQPSFYNDFIVSIDFIQLCDSLGNCNPDPRSDARIIEALHRFDQYHEGLKCELSSVQIESQNNVTVELVLRNTDSFNYYYLDPEKMGENLFNYFTNGLHLSDSKTHQSFTHCLDVYCPEPWDSWSQDWLSLIMSNESIIISITYNCFEPVPKGNYRAYFTFPGLTYQVAKSEIQQNQGRIWLGELDLEKDVSIKQ